MISVKIEVRDHYGVREEWKGEAKNTPRVGDAVHIGLNEYRVEDVIWNDIDFDDATVVLGDA